MLLLYQCANGRMPWIRWIAVIDRHVSVGRSFWFYI